MLRTDFNGYKEFEKKLMNAKGIELFKLSTERTRVWVNELQEIVGFIPAGDIVFVIAALSIVAEGIKKEYPEAAQTAEALLSGLRYADCCRLGNGSCEGLKAGDGCSFGKRKE